ncbi:SAM-dependent DNA methyltransferase, partial [Dysosmobacter welbionis]
HDGADVVLFCIHHLFIVGFHQQGQGHPVRAQGGLHHIGDIVLVLLLIEIGQILAGVLLMLGQVVVGPVRHTPQFPPAEGEQILKVRSGLGVETQLLGLVIPQPQILLLDVQALQPVVAVRPPILEPLQIRVRLTEELQLHLLELPDAENEVTRGDLVAEGLADLAHAEGQLPAGGPLDGGKVDKNALGGLR